MRCAVVLLSGGQDSATCLLWTIADLRAEKVVCLSVVYGQRHEVEIQAAEAVVERARVLHPAVDLTHEILQVGNILQGTSPLTDHRREVDTYSSPGALPGGLEATFVPGRNVLFLTLAANRARVLWESFREEVDVVAGICEEDFGGYPDCREDFLRAMQKAANLGLFVERREVEDDPHSEPFRGIRFLAPLLHLTKAESVHLAQGLGEEAFQILEDTHTCYKGEIPPCGRCHACLLRGRGFREAGVEDPLISRLKREGALEPSWEYPG